MYYAAVNASGLDYVSDSQMSVYIQHVIDNLNVFSTCCIFWASWTMLIDNATSTTFKFSDPIFHSTMKDHHPQM